MPRFASKEKEKGEGKREKPGSLGMAGTIGP
jgi:hypothetical protein